MPVEQHLQELVERARSGEPEPFQQLLAVLRQGKTDPAALLELVRSPEPVLRRAALRLCGGDPDGDLLAALATLADDPVASVRQALAEALEEYPWWELDSVLARLLTDLDPDVRLPAVRAARSRPALEPGLVECLKADDYWRVRQEAARALASATPRARRAAAAGRSRRGLRQRRSGQVRRRHRTPSRQAGRLRSRSAAATFYPAQGGPSARRPTPQRPVSHPARLAGGTCATLTLTSNCSRPSARC